MNTNFHSNPESEPVTELGFRTDESGDEIALILDDEEDLVLLDDDSEEVAARPKWRILIVDDEEEVHRVTKLALSNFQFEGQEIEFDHAYSGKEAREKLANFGDYALVLLDVVMEADDSGLQVVNHIRNQLGNKYTRIVLRTGQPGMAPEENVVNDYDIDDYKTKTELTAQKLHTSVVSSLRAYRELKRVDQLVQERTAELEELNQNLMDSIYYAERIQRTILPDLASIREVLPHSFVFFQPKDIVSGDFFFFEHKANVTIIANIDCTGHGVPGAFMSLMGHSLLQQTVHEMEIVVPDAILYNLDERVRSTLKQDERNFRSGGVADGMDLAICVIHHTTRELVFAGAQRPLYVIRNGEVLQLAGNKNPVGDSRIEEKVFEAHRLRLEPGDRLFLFTDGFTDQFGGENNRKYGTKRFREFLLATSSFSLQDQGLALKLEFNQWRGEIDQTDDVCLIGLEPYPASVLATA